MAELKPGWQRVKFGEVVRLNKETCKDPEAAGIDRVIGLEHLEPGDLRVRSWADVADGTTFSNRVRPGQVLFGKRRAYQRKVAVADFDAICSGDIYVFETADQTQLLQELLPYICQTDSFFDYAVGTSAGSLSPRTNWKSLTEYEFLLPPVDEQHRIAMLLTQANNVVIHAAAGVEAANALQHAFDEDFFVRASKTYPMHPISAVSECYSRRHEASDREFDVDPGAPSAIPVLRSLNVWPGRFDLSELRYISAAGNTAQAKLQLCEGDVLVVRTGDAGRPGNAAVVPREMVGWNCLDIILMRPLALVRSEILEAALNRPSSLQRLTSLSPGTKQKHLTMTDLHRLLLPVPPRPVQDVYAQKRRAILDVVAASNTRLSKARTTRAILQNLLQ